MPNGAGQDADLQDLDAVPLDTDEQRQRRGQNAERAREGHQPEQSRPVRQQLQPDGRGERDQDRKREQHHARSGCSTKPGGVGANRVDVVGPR